ncbi:MAG: ISAs1 family transposase, partial [Candidatus Gastranaerophilales bacterium]|nr:ISAs1 family transposase [Candidatus Gastranaerophilales bacterium]
MEKTSLHKYFGKIKDPRINRKKKHKLLDVIVLTVIAVICGAESWDSIEEFGKSRIDFLRKILELPNGIPSHDTFNRIFSIIKPGYFEKFFIEWANS